MTTTVGREPMWDDESGTPSPLSAADMDARLEATTARLVVQRASLERLNQELEALISERAALLERMDMQWLQFTEEAALLSERERDTRRKARQLVPVPAKTR